MPNDDDNNENNDNEVAAAPTSNEPDHVDTIDIESIPSLEREACIRAVFDAFFTEGGTAYTRDEIPVSRWYCSACLRAEMGSVRRAREEFGQGLNVSEAVLQTIAMGKLEFYLPRYDNLLRHVRRFCAHQPRRARKVARALRDRLRELAASAVYRNPADYGSVYEETAYPKLLPVPLTVPGSASPASIFAAHERALLGVAKRKRERKVKQREALDEPAIPEAGTEAAVGQEQGGEEELLDDSSATEHSTESEGEAKLERSAQSDLLGRKRKRQKQLDSELEKRYAVDESLLFDPAASGGAESQDLPRDFPESETLKALQGYSRDFYAARGLLSSAAVPRDSHERKVTSMVQSLDGSALIALGMLTQELVRAELLPAAGRPAQPVSDYFTRKFGKPGWALPDGYRRKSLAKATHTVLGTLPEGSTVGMKELLEACKRTREGREQANALVQAGGAAGIPDGRGQVQTAADGIDDAHD